MTRVLRPNWKQHARGYPPALDRYYIKTSYHVWSIIDRETQNPVAHHGARGQGDKAAREKARSECARLNEKYEWKQACERGEHMDTEDGCCLVCGKWVLPYV